MSAAELTATEEADMADCDGDKVVTMMDVLQEQEDFEEDANAVLGASDEKNCTYPKGYIKRQALYACLTCCPDANTDPTKRAGVCLACSLACHENHELIELYTKRNFCCDCGNPKFNSHPCQFTPNKTDLNDNNNYNQNFSGLYCVCHRPYPDPEATFEDEMIQCVVCEDWLHSSHLEAKVPPNEQYSEMICKACMEKNEFLYDYSEFAVNVESDDVDIISTDKVNSLCNGDSEKTDTKENGDVDMADVQEKTSAEEKKDSESTDKEEVESEEKTADVAMKDNQAQNTDDKSEVSTENEAAEEKVPDNPQNEDDTDAATERDTSDNKEETAGDSTEESKKDELAKSIDDSSDPISDKPDELADSEDKKSNEQSSSITDDQADKNTNDSDETAKPTEEGNKVEPDSAANKLTENTDTKTDTVTKDEDKKVENSETKQETTEDVKDDLLESIDRIINGDDVSSEQSKDKVETNGEQDKSTEESEKTENSPEETEKQMDDTKENGDIVLEEEKDESKSDVDMEDSTKPNEAEIEPSNENKRKLDEDAIDKVDFKKPKLGDANDCVRPKIVKKHFKGATFWPCNFRQKLCTCNECITMYKDLSVLFLIDAEDTVSAYEALGKEKNDGRSSQYEIGMQALSSLDRIQQINALTEYNKMRDKLLDFLKSFKDRKEIVKEEDIRAFFAGMKPKREPDGVYFCR